MTPKERVVRAIERREPDKVPIDFGGVCWSIVDSPYMDHHPYNNLCSYLGISDYAEPSCDPLMYEVTNVDERVLTRLGVDIRYMHARIPPFTFDPRGGAVIGAFGMRMKPVGYYGTADRYPMRELKSAKEIEEYPYWPDPHDPIFKQEGLRERAIAFRKKYPDHALGIELPPHCSVQFDLSEFMFGMDRLMYNLKNRPDLHHAWYNKYFRVTDPIIENILPQVGDILDIVVIYNDAGTMQGTLCSYDDYTKHLKPYEERQLQRVKNLAPNLKIIMHSCGAVSTLIKDRAEMGLDVLNPMNPRAKNMNPEYLKEHFGSIICFHGGVDIQRLLPFGNPSEIREEVKRLIKLWMPTGGWIAAPSHNIQPDTPPENIMAVYDTLQEYGDGKFITEA